MTDRSILVLGGTGKTGRRVVTRLRQRGRTVRAASRAGQTYELSGPRLLTFGAAVEEIARATGRDIRYRPVSAAEYAAHAVQSAVPAEFADVVRSAAAS